MLAQNTPNTNATFITNTQNKQINQQSSTNISQIQFRLANLYIPSSTFIWFLFYLHNININTWYPSFIVIGQTYKHIYTTQQRYKRIHTCNNHFIKKISQHKQIYQCNFANNHTKQTNQPSVNKKFATMHYINLLWFLSATLT